MVEPGRMSSGPPESAHTDAPEAQCIFEIPADPSWHGYRTELAVNEIAKVLPAFGVRRGEG